MKYIKAIIFAIFLFVSIPGSACTIFCAVDSRGQVWAGNNEDGVFQFNSFINVFIKEIDTKYGYYTLSFENSENGSNSNAQGGMNEAGLFFDINALDASKKEYPIKNLPKKKSYPKGDSEIYRNILGNFSTVHEVVAFFDEYWFNFGFNGVQMHFADKYGNFAMIGPSGSRILENNKYQVSTNFSICANDPTFGCWRYPIAVEKLENQSVGLDTFRDICRSTSQSSNTTTIYSSISNLNTGDLWFFYALDYDNPYKTSMKNLLALGKKSYQMSDLFETNVFNDIYEVFLTKGGQESYEIFQNKQLPDKTRSGILGIFGSRIVEDRGDFEAYPFFKEYIKIDSLNRYLQITDAIWKLHNGEKDAAVKTILDYKRKIPDTGMDVEKIVSRLNGEFDVDYNAIFELNGYQDAKIVLVKGLSKDVGNFLFKRDGKWIGKFKLNNGIYNYSFLVDGKEIFDCKTPVKVIKMNFPGSKPFRSHQLAIGLSSDMYQKTIRVKTINKDDVVHITGNQRSLTNWVSLIKMKKISDYEREIVLDLHLPAQIKFTRGTWESEAIVKGYEDMNDGYYKPLIIDIYSSKNEFEIKNWKDQIKK